MKLTIKVIPGSSENTVVNILPDGTLKVKLTASPVDGAANKALITLLAKHFNVPKHAITILKGETSKVKLVEIDEK